MRSTDPAVDRPESRTAKARAVRLTQTAHRAVDDPAQLARAARIVRAALARERLTLAELTPLPTPTAAGQQGEVAS
jgi:hypothetical protein